ncbi:hypothetical protein ON010_g4207 [Phytophthora cinnamomi]|nr:hypothetical protein ON010_g4207 [Phytophthora cinnamomi]
MAEVEVWEQGMGAGSPGNTLTRQARPRRSIWKRVTEKWETIQIEGQGAYSVERLESLNLYCKTTSRGRVMLLCLLSPVPALAIALLIESLPLQSPSEGWTANWVFWVRLLLVQLILSFTSNMQMIRLIPGLNFTIGKQVKLSVGLSAAFMGICLLTADKIGFPVPLTMQLAPIPIGIVHPIMTFLVLGSVLFAKTSPLKPHVDRFHRFFLSCCALTTAFPIYKLLFQRIPEGYRSVAVVILPIWKFAAKRFIVGNTRRLEDIMPLAVAFCADFLSTLFIASLLEFRAMSANRKALFKLLDERRNSRTLTRKKFDSLDTASLLVIILEAMQKSASLPPKSLERVRLWACLPYPLTTERLEHLHTLDASDVYRHEDTISRRFADQKHHHASLRRHEYQHIRSASIIPHSGENKPANLHSDPGTEATNRHNQRLDKIVVQGVQLLFHAEYVALVQYVESMVPIVFLVFKSVLEHLPNVVYYPGGAGAWDMQSTLNTALFAATEVILLLSFDTFLRHKFGFSPLYQVAFVLETEFYVVQPMLFPFILIILQYELEHFELADTNFGRHPILQITSISKQGIKPEDTTDESGRTEGGDDSSFGGG